MIAFALLLGALIVWAPSMDADHDSRLNRCYFVDREMRQIHGPCKPEETAGYRRER